MEKQKRVAIYCRVSKFMTNTETIFHLTKQSNIKFNPECFTYGEVWKFNFQTNTEHPAPFPIELPKRCILSTSLENDIVLDPLIGSGTTAVACKKLNRHFIGFEINSEYVAIANKRLANVPARLEVFDEHNCQ